MGDRRTRAFAPLVFVRGEIIRQIAIVPGIEPDFRRFIRLQDEWHQIVTPIGARDLKLQAFWLAQLPPKAVAHGEAQTQKISAVDGPCWIAEIHHRAAFADRVALRGNHERQWLHGNPRRSRIIFFQTEDSGSQFFRRTVVAADPEPYIRGAREVRHFVDGNAQVAVGEVEAGRSRGALVSVDIELRQIGAAGEKRLQHSASNVAARGDAEYVLIREEHDRIVLSAVLLKVADAGSEHLGEGRRIAETAELPEATRTFRQRVPHLGQTIAEAGWLEYCNRLAKHYGTCNCDNRHQSRDSPRTKREEDRAGKKHHGVHGKDNVLRIRTHQPGLHGGKREDEGTEQKSSARGEAAVTIVRHKMPHQKDDAARNQSDE